MIKLISVLVFLVGSGGCKSRTSSFTAGAGQVKNVIPASHSEKGPPPNSSSAKLQFLSQAYGPDVIDNIVAAGITLVHYLEFNLVHHVAIRIKENQDFFQMELQAIKESKRVENIQGMRKTGANITSYGIGAGGIADIYLYTEEAERARLEEFYPLQDTQAVCWLPGQPKQSLDEVQRCLIDYIQPFLIPLEKGGQSVDWTPLSSNCGHFATIALNHCGLSNCFNFSQRNGFFHKEGRLEPYMQKSDAKN